MIMNIVKSNCDLLYNMPDLLVRKWIVIELAHLHHSVEIHIQQLEHHIQHVVKPQNFAARHDVLMFKTNHGFDLGVPHCRLPRRKLLFECLYCVLSLVLRVKYLIDHSK
jgi:hypothetical protein